MIEIGRYDQIQREDRLCPLLVDLIKLKMKFTSFSSVLNTHLLGTSFTGK